MYHRVDKSGYSKLEGFSYLNKNNTEETVTLAFDTVMVTDGECRRVYIYTKDIPMLIKALQAAYDHKGN